MTVTPSRKRGVSHLMLGRMLFSRRMTNGCGLVETNVVSSPGEHDYGDHLPIRPVIVLVALGGGYAKCLLRVADAEYAYNRPMARAVGIATAAAATGSFRGNPGLSENAGYSPGERLQNVCVYGNGGRNYGYPTPLLYFYSRVFHLFLPEVYMPVICLSSFFWLPSRACT
jgi:hypothetical protein